MVALGITSNIGAFFIFAFLIGLFVSGYFFRIIKSSLDGMDELPGLNNWNDMFISGIKVFIVSFVYLIPALLIIIIASYLSSPSTIVNTILCIIVLCKWRFRGTNGIFYFF